MAFITPCVHGAGTLSHRQIRPRHRPMTSQPQRLRPSASQRSPMQARCEEVKIDRPTLNRRKISSGILINKPTDVVWKVLTDYNRLADFIPNLALSRRRYHPQGQIRLEQSGVQSLLGFEFKANVVMDMTEVNADQLNRAILFKMVESRDFTSFQGRWLLNTRKDDTATYLRYEVEVQPRGLVPVRLVEWRIGEDVPVNLEAVKRKAESLRGVKA